MEEIPQLEAPSEYAGMEIAGFRLKDVPCDVFIQIPCCPACGDEIILEADKGRCEKCRRIYYVMAGHSPYTRNVYFRRHDSGEEIGRV